MRVPLSLLCICLNAAAATPFIDAVSRPSALVGWGPLAVTISGANLCADFDTSCTIHFGDLVLHPDSVGLGRIGFTVPYTALSTPRIVSVTVANTSGSSNAVLFPISNQTPPPSTTRQIYPMSEPIAVITGDFNRDGKPDVAVANWCSTRITSCTPGTVSVLLGNGSGNFTLGFSSAAGDQPNALATGDFNNDGNQDLVAVSSDKTVTILLGDGAGTFHAAYFKVGQQNIGSLDTVTVGDFNSDGKPDLVIAGAGNGPFLLFGDGTGNFSSSSGQLGTDGATSVVAADFNGDGHLDLAIAYFYSNNVTVLLGDGAGRFSALTVPVGSSARSIAVGDFNADGNRDLVVALLYQGLVVLSGDGTGRFTPASAAIPLTQPVSIAVADLNGDRNLDLAVASQSGGLTLLTGDGTGRFNPGAPILAGMTPISVAVGDFNGDSLPDFAVASGNDGAFSILTQNASTPLRTLYTVHDACPVPNCSLTLLSDNGVVAGPDIAVYPDTGYINFFERTGQHLYPFSINRAGVIAGGTDSFSLDLRALAWVPGENAFLDLDTVFGWAHGRAEYVNDRNQIVGEPLPGVVTGVVQVLPLSRVAAVTNNGIVVGNDLADRGILYSPGIGIAYVANSLGHGAFNSAGQVLNSAPVIDKFLTVGSGVTSLPSPSSPFNTVSFNDVGQFVGFVPSGQTSAAAIYTASGGLVPLDTLLPAGSGWTLNYGVAINNTGQILASGTLHGVPSFALLTPYMQGTTAPSPATAQRHPERRVACEGLTFNARTLCSDAPTRSAWRAL